jgi:hypothetical protein
VSQRFVGKSSRLYLDSNSEPSKEPLANLPRVLCPDWYTGDNKSPLCLPLPPLLIHIIGLTVEFIELLHRLCFSQSPTHPASHKAQHLVLLTKPNTSCFSQSTTPSASHRAQRLELLTQHSTPCFSQIPTHPPSHKAQHLVLLTNPNASSFS